jgi:aspartyl-tRNA(Asn)/glutamyl-tRNA(Gln) amidotransferase subunit B
MTIKEYCEKILLDHPARVEDYKNGDDIVIGFLIGQVMIECRGSENPKLVRIAMKELLDEKTK